MPHPVRSLLRVVLAGVVLLCLAAGRVRACDMNVREAGFLTQAGVPYVPRNYTLWYVEQISTPEGRAYVERVQEFCRARGINLQGTLIPAGRQPASMRRNLERQGVVLDELPVSVVLQSGDDLRTLRLQRGMLAEALIRSMAATPAKETMKRLLADNANYCVLLFAPGANEEAGAAALAEVRAAIRKHGRTRPKQRVPTLRLDRDDPREAFLRSELGLDADGPAHAAPPAGRNGRRFSLLRLAPALLAVALAAAAVLAVALARLRGRPRLRRALLGAGAAVLVGSGLCLALRPPWARRGASGGGAEPAAAIVFGKGRVLLPVFRGRAIRRDAVARRLAFLSENASDCDEDPIFVTHETRDLLLPWEAELDRRLIRQIIDSGAVPELEKKLTAWCKEVSFNASGDPIEPDPPRPGAPPAPREGAGGSRALWAGPVLATAGALALLFAAGWLRMRKRRSA